MKQALNLFVLFAFLMTTMPITPVYAAGDAKDADTDNVTIEVPAEAVAISEKLVAENADANKNTESENGPSCIKSGVAYSPRMTKQQRKELFVHGQITDCEGNIWNVKVIPGSDASKQMTIKSWRYAGKKTKQMFTIETYKKAISHGKYASKASFNFTKRSSKLLKKGIWDYMIVEGVYKDLIVSNAIVWKNAGVTVANLRGSFAWLFGAIYGGILKPVTLTGVNIIKAAYHITAGTVILVGGIAGTAGGIVATIASPIIVPVVEVMTLPLLAVGSILTTGTIIPGVVYAWNGTAWISTQLSHVPDSEVTVAGVRFVRLKNPKQPEKPKVEITSQNLNDVVGASVKAAALKTQQADLLAKRNEIEKQIQALQAQMSAINNQYYALETKHSQDQTVKAVAELLNKVYYADVTVNASVTELLNDVQLKELVLNFSEQNGISLTDAEIDAAVVKIKATMKNLSA